jgi:hypothetical protein
MSHLESIPEVPASYDHNYKYFNDEVSGWVLKLADQKNEDFEEIFINESSFIAFADFFNINLDEFYFKYSPVSIVCNHEDSSSRRCYNLGLVLEIFSELKAGLASLEEGARCCLTGLPLCLSEHRDEQLGSFIHDQKTLLPYCNTEEAYCLLYQERYIRPSRVRLLSSGTVYSVNGVPRYVLDMKFLKSDRVLKRNDHSKLVKTKARKLNEALTRIFQDKNKRPEHY